MRVGIDLVEVGRISHAMENPRFRARVLTETEDSYCRTVNSVAGRWAAKEAIYKAVGAELGWQDVEIVNGENGEPEARFLRADAIPEGHRVHISIAHERGMAIAMAVFERTS